MKRDFDLDEMARDLSVSIEDLIRFAARDELTIFVVAQEWPASSSNGLSDTVLVDPVDLVASDLQRSMNADHTMVRQVRRHGTNDCLTLDKPQEVRRGDHFVTAEELQRFKNRHCEFDAQQIRDLAPYLDPQHEYYSSTLDDAVRAWLALFVDGGYERGRKPMIPIIEEWLWLNTSIESKNAIKKIATLINPDTTSRAGVPKKLRKKNRGT